MHLYLNIRERGRLHEDDEGATFTTLDDARKEALLSAREMMAERIVRGRPINDISFEITNESRDVLLVLPWEDALVRA
jgi:hypothetical protein